MTVTAEDFLVESVSRLLRHLREKAIPFCLAIGSHRLHFELKTQSYCELFSLMHYVVSGDDPEVK